MLQFVTILEQNHKENESVLHYCQWDGNEAELEALFAVIDIASEYTGAYGHVSTFQYERTLIPESAVRYHVRLSYGNFTHMFQRHKGVFRCPVTLKRKVTWIDDEEGNLEEPLTDPGECVSRLDEEMYAAGLGRHFTLGTQSVGTAPAPCDHCGV